MARNNRVLSHQWHPVWRCDKCPRGPGKGGPRVIIARLCIQCVQIRLGRDKVLATAAQQIPALGMRGGLWLYRDQAIEQGTPRHIDGRRGKDIAVDRNRQHPASLKSGMAGFMPGPAARHPRHPRLVPIGTQHHLDRGIAIQPHQSPPDAGTTPSMASVTRVSLEFMNCFRRRVLRCGCLARQTKADPAPGWRGLHPAQAGCGGQRDDLMRAKSQMQAGLVAQTFNPPHQRRQTVALDDMFGAQSHLHRPRWRARGETVRQKQREAGLTQTACDTDADRVLGTRARGPNCPRRPRSTPPTWVSMVIASICSCVTYRDVAPGSACIRFNSTRRSARRRPWPQSAHLPRGGRAALPAISVTVGRFIRAGSSSQSDIRQSQIKWPGVPLRLWPARN